MSVDKFQEFQAIAEEKILKLAEEHITVDMFEEVDYEVDTHEFDIELSRWLENFLIDFHDSIIKELKSREDFLYKLLHRHGREINEFLSDGFF